MNKIWWTTGRRIGLNIAPAVAAAAAGNMAIKFEIIKEIHP